MDVLEYCGRIVVVVLPQARGVIVPDQVYVPGIVTVNPKKGEKGRRGWLHTIVAASPASAAGAHG